MTMSQVLLSYSHSLPLFPLFSPFPVKEMKTQRFFFSIDTTVAGDKQFHRKPSVGVLSLWFKAGARLCPTAQHRAYSLTESGVLTQHTEDHKGQVFLGLVGCQGEEFTLDVHYAPLVCGGGFGSVVGVLMCICECCTCCVHTHVCTCPHVHTWCVCMCVCADMCAHVCSYL